MNTKELEQIIENHRHWLKEDIDGWGNMRAYLSKAYMRYVDLSGADLSCAYLSYANLSYANLGCADLSCANLSGANLSGANLSEVNLSGANLSYANLGEANLIDAKLSCANLSWANLSGANLSGANLSCADLSGADLSGANLSGANLGRANLRFTNLSCANLSGANLSCADLRYAKNVPYIPMICPEEGSFIGYKKASGKIIKLYIPEDAKRSSATSRKCRCNKAIVLNIYEIDGNISNVTEVQSDYDSNFIYKINKEVVVDNFDNDRWNGCSTGIHFFMQKHEAIDYKI